MPKGYRKQNHNAPRPWLVTAAGEARLDKLTPERRREIAAKGGQAQHALLDKLCQEFQRVNEEKSFRMAVYAIYRMGQQARKEQMREYGHHRGQQQGQQADEGAA